MSKPIFSITAFIIMSLIIIVYLTVSVFRINTARSNKIYGIYGACMFLIVISNMMIMLGNKPWILWFGIIFYYIALVGLSITMGLCYKDKGYDNNKTAYFLSYLLVVVAGIGIGSVGSRVVAGLASGNLATANESAHGGGNVEKFNDTMSSYLYSDSKSPYSLASLSESSLF